MVPELVGKLTGLGYAVSVEPGAGRRALIDDEEYAAAGAVLDDRALDDADLVVSVQPLATDAIRRLRRERRRSRSSRPARRRRRCGTCATAA